MNIKELRISRKLTQKEAAQALGISLRSYISYETDESKSNTVKYKYILQELEKLNKIDENHGILALKDIESVCDGILKNYNVSYCYLFGSYAKGTAGENSDVDLLISTNVKGLKYFEMAELLRENLHKKVDLLDIKQVVNNEKLLDEIFKDGLKIYG